MPVLLYSTVLPLPSWLLFCSLWENKGGQQEVSWPRVKNGEADRIGYSPFPRNVHMISAEAWRTEATRQGPHPLTAGRFPPSLSPSTHPGPPGLRKDRMQKEAWLGVRRQREVPSKQQQMFPGAATAILELHSDAPTASTPQPPSLSP